MAVAAALLFVLGWWLGSRRPSSTPPAGGRKAEPAAAEKRALEESSSVPRPRSLASPLPALAGRVAIVIDDLGREPSDIDRLGELGVPISFSVLPFESHTAEIVAEPVDI